MRSRAPKARPSRVKGLNGDKPYTIGKDGIVVLGPAFQFDATNVDTFNF